MSDVWVAAIIPARLGSSRFPGKPLLRVRGLPMVEHVRRRALLCRKFSEVVVATCDREIHETVRQLGGRSLMTSPAHPAATDRVAEAARQLDCTHVVNVQGDELLVMPEDLERFVDAMAAAPDVPAWNAIARIEQPEELVDRSIVKCVVSVSGRILFCARDLSRLGENGQWHHVPVRKILGILGYRKDFLERYGQLARTPLETVEAIDQSRILEHDVLLRGVEFAYGFPGVNEPHEVSVVERVLEVHPQQRAVLELVCRE